jgi:hypothetical protein
VLDFWSGLVCIGQQLQYLRLFVQLLLLLLLLLLPTVPVLERICGLSVIRPFFVLSYFTTRTKSLLLTTKGES